MNNFNKIVEEICIEKGINCTFLSKDWLIILEKDGKRRFITGYKFDINSCGASLLSDDKFSTYTYLNNQNIPVVSEKIIYSSSNKNAFAKDANSIEVVKDYFEKYNNNIVIKQNKGTCGNGIEHITDMDTLEEVYERMSRRYYSVCLSPYYDIENEYRVIMVDSNPRLMYKKMKPVVIGNGKDDIKTLLCNFNPKFFENKEIKENRVLAENEVYQYDWKHNLCKGAKVSMDIDEEIRKIIQDLAIRTANTIGLRFESVDIIKTYNNEYYVMEVNSGVMMDNFIDQIEDGYEISKNIYREVIDKMMEE